MFLGITIFSVLYYFSETSSRTKVSKKSFLDKSVSVFESVRLGFEVGLSNENFRSINQVFDWAKAQTNLKWIIISDSEKQIFASFPRNIKITLKNINKRLKNNNLKNSVYIKVGKWKTIHDYGKIYIAFKTDTLIKEKKEILQDIGLLVGVIMLVSFIFTLIFSYSISSPLKLLYSVTNDILNGDFDKRVSEYGGSFEITAVSHSFNKMMDQLVSEQKKSDELLLNILPPQIANRLKNKEETIADNYYNCSVLFADIVGFTPLSSNMSASQLVSILNNVFSRFDDLTQKYNLEKIKTIGDCYMVAGGLLDKSNNHLHNICYMGLGIIEAVEALNKELKLSLNVRVGIHVGPATAGVIGKKKFIYDLWGNSVNIASRMESHGFAGKVHISKEVYNLVKNEFNCEKQEPIEIKGKGLMQTFILLKASWENSHKSNNL